MGNSKKKKTDILQVPDHENLCQALGELLAQNEEPMKIWKEGHSFIFCL